MDLLSAVAVVCLCCFGRFSNVYGRTRIEVSSPGEVKEGGILVLMCQIWDLDAVLHGVKLSRQIGERPEPLTWNDGYEKLDDTADEDSERMYLAKRTHEDGSTIYFLSILEITRRDAGIYSCQVIQWGDDVKQVARENIKIAVQYVPSDIYPECSHPGPMEVFAGKPVVFNCTSEQANPELTIQWQRANKEIHVSVQYNRDGIAYSELTFTPEPADDRTVFFCKLSSSAFPDFLKTCYVGPITVRPDPSNPNLPPSDRSAVSPTLSTEVEISKQKPDTKLSPNIPSLESSDCRTSCMSSRGTTWKISTLSAAVAAVILLLLDIILFIKVYRFGDATRRQSGSQSGYLKEDIYVELPQTGGQNRLYMTLEPGKGGSRSNTNQQQAVVPVPNAMFVHPNAGSCNDRIVK